MIETPKDKRMKQSMQPKQLPLFPNSSKTPIFPTTRYQGSKRKFVSWIGHHVQSIPFTTVLDVFGGTGVVSHWFKQQGKQVTYNDHLQFNHEIGKALIENRNVVLTDTDIQRLLHAVPKQANTTIQDHFSGIYFTDEENRWLDHMIYNINHLLENPYKQALARFALFQACIAKRPFNLFHRANLYMLTADVKRSFGNKTTWDTPFADHFVQFAMEANAAVFDNGKENRALCMDAHDTPTGFDLVYLDPPYLNQKGIGVDYRDFYHFLEGIMSYEQWPQQIDTRSKHRRLIRQPSDWQNADTILMAFEALIARHKDSVIVLSYRSDGLPTVTELDALLKKYKPNVTFFEQAQQYVLSTQKSKEVLWIAKNPIRRIVDVPNWQN